ncbi:MAG: hypothetical protein WCG78_05245 [Candidatus Omnitrophota bacterium]
MKRTSLVLVGLFFLLGCVCVWSANASQRARCSSHSRVILGPAFYLATRYHLPSTVTSLRAAARNMHYASSATQSL